VEDKEILLPGVRANGENLWWIKSNTVPDCHHHGNLPNVFECFCQDHPLPRFPPFKSVHSSKAERNNVLVSGMARSGSTVAWQATSLLNDERVLKSHGFADCCPTLYNFDNVIVTIRHPFDAYASQVRVTSRRLSLHKLRHNISNSFEPSSLIRKETDSEEKQRLYEKLFFQCNEVRSFLLLKRFQELTGYRSDMNITFLKYEDFWCKDEDRITFLAKTINKKISNKERSRILLETSLDKNIERSKSGQDYSEKNKGRTTPTPRIHVDHVGEKRGEPGQGSFLDSESKSIILENISWLFDEFGYDKTL